ncbi:MAG: 3-deoxy-D-manno-octulosonic acid transferase [Pseudomonadota bacterium]
MKTSLQSLALNGYAVLSRMLVPLAMHRFLKTAGDDSALRARQRERKGFVAQASDELWLHAASVGEVHAAQELVRRLLASDQTLRLVISTQTVTAAARARALFADEARVRHQFAPFDTRFAVRRWLRLTQPRALLLIETEIWPVLLDECSRRSIPVALVNARLSASSMRGYAALRALFLPALQTIEPILCQSEFDRKRFTSLLGDARSVQLTGNIKFDQPAIAETDQRVLMWRPRWDDRPLWVAGSTHAGEERIALAAHRKVLAECPDALLILVPRHPERALPLFDEFRAKGELIDWPDQIQSRTRVTMIDQMGVLTSLYGLADACFVGGSLLAGIGGHNLLEPASAGRAVITGPYLDGQQASVEVLGEADVLTQVADEHALADAVIDALRQPGQAALRGRRALNAAQAQAGALERSLDVLRPWLAATTA